MSLIRLLVRVASIVAILKAPAELKSQTPDEQAIRAVVSAYQASINRGDLEATVALFAPSGVVMPPGVPLVEGPDAVRARYQGLFATETLDTRFTTVEAVASGDYGFARIALSGTFTMKADGKPQTQNAKALMLFKRTPGGWRITHYMANSNKE